MLEEHRRELTRRLLKDETSHWSEGGVGAGYGVCKGDSS